MNDKNNLEEEISENDLCEICEEELYLKKDGYKRCPVCKNRYCISCFEKHIAAGDLTCPGCGSGPDKC